jgi:hypothetical protein
MPRSSGSRVVPETAPSGVEGAPASPLLNNEPEEEDANSQKRQRRRSKLTAFDVDNGRWFDVFAKREHLVLEKETGSEAHTITDNEAKLVSYKSSRDWWAVLFTTERILPNWRPVRHQLLPDSRIHTVNTAHTSHTLHA